MRFALKYLSILSVPLLLVGCLSRKSPYDYAENWVAREDPVRPFMVHADVIYLQDELYTNRMHFSRMQMYADSQVGNGRFGGVARVFSPLVTNADDLELAVKWYLKHHCEDGRYFVFIGEGEGGRLLSDYDAANHDYLVKRGLIASYYADAPRNDFVTDAMVKEIRAAVSAARYKSIWGRDMPKGLLGE